MKTNINKIFSLLLFTAIIAGCTQDLDLVPPSTISDGSFWKVSSDFEKAANSFYFSLSSHGNGGLDQNSDIAVGAGPNDISAGNLVVPQSSGTWNGNYSMIRATNRLLENYEKATDLQDEAARYAGEARFFRARAYFSLVSTFGDVPLITRVLDLDSEELDSPRSPRADVVAVALGDLDWAVDNLPLESELSANEKGRVTKGAALALKSRIALFEGTWSKYHLGGLNANQYLTEAIDAAEQLIASAEYDLYDGMGLQSYRNLFLEPGVNSSESILGRRYNINLNAFHNTTRWMLTAFNSPTKNLVDLYVCTDGLPIDKSTSFQGYDEMDSEFENRDPRLSQTVFVPGTTFNNLGADEVIIPQIGGGNNGPTKSGYRTYKFVSDNITSQLGQCFYDFLEYRYGEVLLNLAEALYERDGSISDTDLNRTINKLRDRVGITHLTNNLVSDYGLDMLTEIRRERTVELAFEGFRLNDLRRWKEAENALPIDLKGVKYVGSEFETTPPNDGLTPGVDIEVDADGFIVADPGQSRKFAPRQYLFPLPLDQIQLNSNLEQNTGWK
ncbi:MAG: RagB/SusD family nutrient uptake outer membrane protein [Cyclobacteriaceae bacterium]